MEIHPLDHVIRQHLKKAVVHKIMRKNKHNPFQNKYQENNKVSAHLNPKSNHEVTK